MNILWQMPTLHRAMCGLSIRAIRLAAELVRRGQTVTFVVNTDKTDIEGGRIENIPVITTPAERGGAIHWSLQAISRRKAARRQIATMCQPHDLFVSCQPEAISAYRAGHSLAPAVLVCGGTTILHDAADREREKSHGLLRRPFFELDRRLKRASESNGFRDASAVVFDSESTCRRVIAAYRVHFGKCHPIHGGVDPIHHRPPSSDERAAARHALGIAPRAVIAVWTGRISIEKNVWLLIHAMAKCRRRPDRLYLVGEGRDSVALREQVAALGLGDSVRFVGSHDDVRPFLFAADIFLFPSVSESFGGSLAEAMACGLPTVALRPDERTLRNASDEILEHGQCGLLVNGNDSISFAEAIGRLVSDPALRGKLGMLAARRAHSDFTWPRAGERLDLLFRRLTTSERRSSHDQVTFNNAAVRPVAAALSD